MCTTVPRCNFLLPEMWTFAYDTLADLKECCAKVIAELDRTADKRNRDVQRTHTAVARSAQKKLMLLQMTHEEHVLSEDGDESESDEVSDGITHPKEMTGAGGVLIKYKRPTKIKAAEARVPLPINEPTNQEIRMIRCTRRLTVPFGGGKLCSTRTPPTVHGFQENRISGSCPVQAAEN